MVKRYSHYWFKLRKGVSKTSNPEISYDAATLSKYINRQGRIIPRIYTKLSAKDQRKVAKKIKTLRQMALLPYTIAEQNEQAKETKRKT